MEQIAEVFGGLAHIFGFDLSVIHTEQRHGDSFGNGMGRHRFPGPRRPVQIDSQTKLLWEPLPQSPRFEKERSVLKIRDHIQKLRRGGPVQDQIGQAVLWFGQLPRNFPAFPWLGHICRRGWWFHLLGHTYGHIITSITINLDRKAGQPVRLSFHLVPKLQ